jgi:hypothetical protein
LRHRQTGGASDIQYRGRGAAAFRRADFARKPIRCISSKPIVHIGRGINEMRRLPDARLQSAPKDFGGEPWSTFLNSF